jgi:hypothetical protein
MGAVAPEAGNEMTAKRKPTRTKMLTSLDTVLQKQLVSAQDFAREQMKFANGQAEKELRSRSIDTAFALAPSVGVDEMLRNAQKIFQWLSAGTVPAPKGELRAV